jgi:hypothetical protein
MNLFICHDVRFFSEAMKRWLAELGKVSVVGVVSTDEAFFAVWCATMKGCDGTRSDLSQLRAER